MDNSSAGDGHAGQQLKGLLDLPAKPLDAILSQLDARSRLPVFRTSKLLATDLLRIVPRIKLTYPNRHDFLGQHHRELAPFLTEALQKRQHPELHLTLEPGCGCVLHMEELHGVEPAAAEADAARLLTWMLGAAPRCGAVNCLTIFWAYKLHLSMEPGNSATLAASFPSLTSLTFHGGRMSIDHLANVINHLPELLHLDMTYITHQGQVGMSPFIGSRLQTLSLSGWVRVNGVCEFLTGLLPFPPTLTQLELNTTHPDHWDWVRIAAAVSSLTQLQQLFIYDEDEYSASNGLGLEALLPALAHLPSLHTLEVDQCVVGQEQLDALLELTQITCLKVQGFSGLTSSRASADCSWRQLEAFFLDWVSAAYLPLHSLTHPLRLNTLAKGIEVKDIEELSVEVLAAAELNLCERNKAGLVLDGNLVHKDLVLSKATVDLLTEQYLNHRSGTAQQPPHPTVASSSSHSEPSTSLASSSSPEGHITPEGPGSSSGQGGQQGGSAAGGQVVMQRLGRCVKLLRIAVQGLEEACLSTANQEALAVLFPTAEIGYKFFD
ncbi:hypothetical protein QJQ45_010626 [Haematococcus lacustris]|nr:hypothetical protein QJQ45_010626 [Haematococcus lacustris]